MSAHFSTTYYIIFLAIADVDTAGDIWVLWDGNAPTQIHFPHEYCKIEAQHFVSP